MATLPSCEQCIRRPATVIWSDSGTFPGLDLCRTCAGRVSADSKRLLAARRRSSPHPL